MSLPGPLHRFVRDARADPNATLLALDIDGTVSPLAPAPGLARVDTELRATLERLAARYRLWFLSGRDATLARQIAGVPGAGYVGAHGLEVLDAEGLRPLAGGAPPAAQLDALARAVTQDVPEAAPHVERKSRSVAFHYRAFGDGHDVTRRLRAAVERHLTPGLRLRPGKMVLEVGPDVPHDKGTALDWLIDTLHPARALVAGDDLTDVEMFRALDRRRNRALDGVSVAVRHPQETPPEVIAAADLAVDGVPALHALLQQLE